MTSAWNAPEAAVAARQIKEALTDMYSAFLESDWERFNAHVDPTVTAWETHLEEMIRGSDGLDDYRRTRPAPQKLSYLRASDHLIDTWGDTSLVRYLLTGASAADPAQTRHSRVTEVFRWDGRAWRIVHRHSERLAPGRTAPPAAGG